MAAIARSAGYDCRVSSATASATLTYPSGTPNLALLVVAVTSNSAVGTISLPAGWTKLSQANAGNNNDACVFYKVSAGETTVAITATGATLIQAQGFVLNNADKAQALAVDTSNSSNGVAATSASTPAITTVDKGDYIFLLCSTIGTNGGGEAWTTATLLQANADTRLQCGEYIPNALLTSFQDTASWTTSRAWIMLAVAFAPSSKTRTVTDTGSGTDTGARTAKLTRGFFTGAGFESANGTDAVTRGVAGHPRTVTDTASGTDAVAGLGVSPRTLAETGAGTDALTRGAAADPRSLTEAGAGTDAVTRSTVAPRALTESVAASDSITRGEAAARSATDTASGADAVTSGGLIARTAADSAAVTDAVAVGGLHPRAATETVAASDSAAAVLAAVRTVTDSAAGTDAASRIGIRTRALTDSAAVTDAAASAAGGSSAVTDAAAGTDSSTRTARLTRTTSQTGAGTDLIGRSSSRSRVGIDAAAGDDSIVLRRVVHGPTLTETVTVSDLAARTARHVAVLTDSAAGADALSRQMLIARTVTDSGAVTDANGHPTGLFRALTDQAAGTDIATRAPIGSSRVLSEPFAVSEELTISALFQRDVSELVAVGETVTGIPRIGVAFYATIGEHTTAEPHGVTHTSARGGVRATKTAAAGRTRTTVGMTS